MAIATQGGYEIAGTPVAKEGGPILVAFAAAKKSKLGSVHVVQETKDQRLWGRDTFVLRARPLEA